jgi:very long chain acyl-CoA dehydrogenase
MAGALSGTMKSLIRRTAEHVSTRVQFGNKLETYGVVQEKIAHMALRQYVTESIAYLLSGNMDRGSIEYQLEAAISKIYASESAWWVADECIQLHGGMGFMTECGLERVMRDLRIFRIFEGSNDILRLFISLTGLQYAGKQLREVEKSVKGMDFGVIMSEGLKRTRRLVGSSSAPSVAEHSHKDLSVQAEQLSQLVGDFGTTCEKLLLTHRKNIIRELFSH